MLHHGLGDAHGVDGIGGLVGGQADNALNTSVNGSMQDIISADDVSLNSLHREELAGRNLLQSGSVEDVVNTRHIILLFLIAGEDADFLQVRIQEVL